jgi:hypothetical protein
LYRSIEIFIPIQKIQIYINQYRRYAQECDNRSHNSNVSDAGRTCPLSQFIMNIRLSWLK